jgi:hypothetical protein
MRMVLPGLLMLLAGSAAAQEGFPLDGTWRGETVAKDGSHRTIVLVMQWDGNAIAGTINPGPQAIEFAAAELKPDGWKVTFSAQDQKGKAIAFDGALAELGKYDRKLAGKWTEGATSFDIRFVRE